MNNLETVNLKTNLRMNVTYCTHGLLNKNIQVITKLHVKFIKSSFYDFIIDILII